MAIPPCVQLFGASEHWLPPGPSPTNAFPRQRHTKQAELRQAIDSVSHEISSLCVLVTAGNLDDKSTADVQSNIDQKRHEYQELEKCLDRLVRGQMRQRKFRQKMKFMRSITDQ